MNEHNTKHTTMSKSYLNWDPLKIAVAFACAVTEKADQDNVIARKGNSSLFHALSLVLPEVWHLILWYHLRF